MERFLESADEELALCRYLTDIVCKSSSIQTHSGGAKLLLNRNVEAFNNFNGSFTRPQRASEPTILNPSQSDPRVGGVRVA